MREYSFADIVLWQKKTRQFIRSGSSVKKLFFSLKGSKLPYDLNSIKRKLFNMKKTISRILLKAAAAAIIVFAISEAIAQQSSDKLLYKYEAINTHSQIYDKSCIPSSIEMVLKLNKKVDTNFYNYQKIWENKMDGTFGNFDNLLLNGIRFHRKFNTARDNKFPLQNLFKTIDTELSNGRYVIVSLPSGYGWHMYVITDKLPNGEFVAYSKNGKENLIETNVKQIITKAKGTDIMTYRLE